MGAPVTAFCRIDERPIRLREPIAEPDAVVVQDPTLLAHVDVFSGLVEDGYVLINSTRSIDELGLTELREHHRSERLVTVGASELARAHTGRQITNATLLGALAGLTAVVSFEALQQAIEQRFAGAAATGNTAAARDAFNLVQAGQASHA
jgi:pyruvate ferredoxin oxidoreductase gamma subunit